MPICRGQIDCALLRLGILTVLVAAVSIPLSGEWPANLDRAEASPKTCFGKKVNRVVRADSVKVRIGFRDVVWVSGRGTTVIGKPYSRICAGPGSQTIRAGKGRSRTDGGPGDDRIILHPSSNRNIVRGGTGDDLIKGSNGHDFILAGPAVSDGDTDTVYGRGGNDRIRDRGGRGNRLFGQNGSDSIRSTGLAVSELHGGNGTDFLYSNGGGSTDTAPEKLFGERGNDRLYGDLEPNNGPAFFDPGPGDDWVRGTPRDDTVLFNAGVKKIATNGGDDLVVAASLGRATIDGGTGTDTISFATHTPPGYRKKTGVYVNLAEGVSKGASEFKLDRFENIIGSSFDDELHGEQGVRNLIYGGLGNDDLTGFEAWGDVGDGGLGQNVCRGFGSTTNCNSESPGDFDKTNPMVEIDESGVLAVIGSTLDDSISVDYDSGTQRYRVTTRPDPVAGGLCKRDPVASRTVGCPAFRQNLNGVLVYGGAGDDQVAIGTSVPASVTTTINGGSGANRLIGGNTKDYISSEAGTSAGTVIEGRNGTDVLYARDDVRVFGGPSADLIRITDPCLGGRVSGGPGRDNVVFAGARKGVRADFGKAFAEWAEGGCPPPSRRVSLAHDLEDLEGTRHNDVLILGPKYRTQDGIGGLLGREGVDYLDSRNGHKDAVTTGSNGRKNTVVADRIDKVTWGWGLAAG